MAQLYFHANYWHANYWNTDYWIETVVAAVTVRFLLMSGRGSYLLRS